MRKGKSIGYFCQFPNCITERGGGGGGPFRFGIEFGSCVKVEVAVLGSPSLIVRTVCVDVKQR